jgi:ankyrin repeat protein
MDAAWERAVTRGDIEAVRQLLLSGADINARGIWLAPRVPELT